MPQDGPNLNRFFFATHTFFAILTKLLAYIIVGRYTNLPSGGLADWKNLSADQLQTRFADLEKGGPFHTAGLRNYLEGDFFAWYVRFFTPELAACLRAVVERLADYDPATLDLAPAPTQDLLKKLYHRLVSPHIRKALGEYYTPDWLAQRVLNMLDGGQFRGDPDVRLLDPTCGSGTFLVMAINAIRRNSIAQSLAPRELLRKICQNIVGIDLNPLAVIAARTNYLLALGPLLAHRGQEPLEIPVYLADSVMTPSRGDELFEQNKVRVWLSIGKVELPLRLASQRGVARLTHLLDEHLAKNPPTPPKDFTRLAEQALKACYSASKLREQNLTADQAWAKDEPTLAALYKTIYDLHKDGRNGMWARILKNAFAPVFLARFDFVAGNPPWINWQNLPEGYRNATKDLWQQHGLFVHRGMDTILGKGKKDISTLVTYVAADSYLKDGGKLGFVITQTVFKTGGAGEGFRRFVTRSKVPLGVIWIDDFSELQLFEGATNRTAVFVVRKGEKTKFPVQYAYWRKKGEGRAGSFDYDAGLEEVTEKTERLSFVAEPADPKNIQSPWLSGRKKALATARRVQGSSTYQGRQGVNTGGANAIFWFERLGQTPQGLVRCRNITEGAKRKIDSRQVELEPERLFPLVRGRDVNRWCAQPSALLLFVQDPETRRGIPEAQLASESKRTYQWLELHREQLLQRSAFKRYFREGRDAFYTMFDVGPYTLAPWKVVWRGQVAPALIAAVVGKADGKVIMPDQTAYFAAFDREDEATFFCGLLNSVFVRLFYALLCYKHVSMDFVQNLALPPFNAANPLHQRIASLAKGAAKAAAAADRKAVVAAEDQLNRACAKLFGIPESDVPEVVQSLAEIEAIPASEIAQDE